MVLCNGKKSTSPPTCIGPSIDLHGVDSHSFELKTAGSGKKRVSFTNRPVAVLGDLEAGQMTVSQVLP
jgi:hypothetical protein